MLEVPFLDGILLEKYGNLLAEKTREAVRENVHQDIAAFLEACFGDVPRDLVDRSSRSSTKNNSKDLVRSAAACPDLAEFRRAMTRG